MDRHQNIRFVCYPPIQVQGYPKNGLIFSSKAVIVSNFFSGIDYLFAEERPLIKSLPLPRAPDSP